LLIIAALITAVGLIVRPGLKAQPRPEKSGQTPPSKLSEPAPAFVGAKACGGCHRPELSQWTGSHHQFAMQPAAAHTTVLGDFNQVKLTSAGITSTFFRDRGKFMVRTDGPDGTLHDYEINYTFGVFPLQQYLIAMPAGRLQALGIAWDSRPRDRSGQRWFSLYLGRSLTFRDSLH
jgi:hypothetical protein